MLNNTQRTACLVGLVGTLVLGMPAVGSGQGTVADDRAALEALYEATDGANWDDNTNWGSSLPLDEWHGVGTFTGGRVHQLLLNNNGLTGEIPAALGSLTSLRWLILTNNNGLTGEIPAALGSLTSLRILEFRNNGLTGAIPAALGSLTNLTQLLLQDNQLTGSIPSSGSLTNLEDFLSENQLTRSRLRSLTNLEDLHLSENQLTGSIPSSLGSLTNLEELWLFDNQLTGEIPSSLGSLTNLRQLWLYDNQLTGSIPSSLGSLTNLTQLLLADNQLSGTIPAELGNLTRLRSLRIDTDTGLCLAPDFDLTSPFATRSGLLVCSTEPPGTLTVTIASEASEPVSGPFLITVTFSEPVTGFELQDLVVGNGRASELQGNQASYTATVTPTASGAVTVDIATGAAEDSAGNPSAAANQFSITADLTPVPAPALPLAGAVALAALLLIGGIRRRRGVLTT